MFIQDVLFLIDDIYVEYKSSKNIFMRKRRLNKNFEKIEKLVDKRCEKIDYDLLNEFIVVYNSTYEKIKIEDEAIRMWVADDPVINNRILQIWTRESDKIIFITLKKKGKGFNITIRKNESMPEPPFSQDFDNDLVYDGEVDYTKEFVKVIRSTIALLINIYIFKYLENKK